MNMGYAHNEARLMISAGFFLVQLIQNYNVSIFLFGQRIQQLLRLVCWIEGRGTVL